MKRFYLCVNQIFHYKYISFKNVSEQRCSSAIREVEDDLQKILRSTRPKPEEPVRDPEVERLHEESGALFSRLRFVRLLYQEPML
jgi:hypothetical protein